MKPFMRRVLIKDSCLYFGVVLLSMRFWAQSNGCAGNTLLQQKQLMLNASDVPVTSIFFALTRYAKLINMECMLAYNIDLTDAPMAESAALAVQKHPEITSRFIEALAGRPSALQGREEDLFRSLIVNTGDVQQLGGRASPATYRRNPVAYGLS